MRIEELLAGRAGRRAADGRSSATKRSLLQVSRSLEALAGQLAEAGEPFAVVSLFEHAGYFGYERERYARLAEVGTVVVGFAGTAEEVAAARVPDGVHHLHFDRADPISEEWNVLLLSEPITAGLVANDLASVVAANSAANSLERGRLFSPAVGTDPTWVVQEAQRILRHADPALAEVVLAPGRAAAERVTSRGEQVLREELEAGWWRTLTRLEQTGGVERLALTDALTGARTRRFLERFLSRVGDRAPRLAVVLFDLDGLTGINDAYGRSVGDAALRRFAATVRAHVRETDLLVRYGDDELLLLLPGTPQQVATERTQRLLEEWSAQRLPAPAQDAGLAASAGVGVFPADDLDLDALEAAVCSAKAAGGGRMVALPDSPPQGD